MNLIIQTCIPDYRLKVYNYILEKDKSVKIIAGDEYYTASIKSVKSLQNVIWIDNLFFLNRKFLIQKLPWEKIFRAQNIVIEFNLRNISFYLVLFSRLLLGKKTYLWGHAWSRAGKKSKSEYLRFIFKKISSGYIAYTNEQAKELKLQLVNKRIFSASNAIYYKKEMMPLNMDESEITNFVYVGRLVKEKKPLFMVQAFQKTIKRLPSDTKLFIIGSGPEQKIIEEFVKQNDLEERVIVYGHISNYDKLRHIYSTSIASISPGYVGLSITQSLGFGVPMIISKDEPHSPELEAAIIGENSEYFKTDNVDDLAEILCSFYSKKTQWFMKRDEISKKCRNMYSVEKMAEPFLNILKVEK